MLRETRWLAAFIVPFLVVAFVVLYPWPKSTDRWFAWEINPTMTPMVLGLPRRRLLLHARVPGDALAHDQGRAGAGDPVRHVPGVSTIIHWDKFDHGHIAFWLWAGLYFTTPFLVATVFVLNHRHDRPAAADELMLSRSAVLIIGLTGVAALLLGLFLFLVPDEAIDVWPWALTPLTSRVIGAVLMLGVSGLMIVTDARWSTARLMLHVERVMVVLILIAAARVHDEFNTDRPLTWMLGIGLVTILVASTTLDITMRRKVNAARSPG